MTAKRFGLLGLLWLSELVWAFGPSHARADDTLSVVFSQAHEFHGFGAQVWVDTQNWSQAHDLLRKMHATDVRVSIPVDLSHVKLDPHWTVSQFCDALRMPMGSVQAQRVSDFASTMQRDHIHIHGVSWRIPADWSQQTNSERNNVIDSQIESYARLLTAQLILMKDLGLSFFGVELTNEPASHWDTFYSPDQYYQLVAKTRGLFNSNGLQNVKIEGPGVGVKNLRQYTSDPHTGIFNSNIDIITVHEYDRGEPGKPWEQAERIDRTTNTVPVVTEFGNAASRWSLPPYEGGPEHRSKVNGSSTTEFGVTVLADAMQLLSGGVKSLFYWELQDQSWASGAFGLIDENGHLKDSGAVISGVLHNIPTSTVVSTFRDAASALTAANFHDSRGDILVVVNPTLSQRKLRFKPCTDGSKCEITLVTSFGGPSEWEVKPSPDDFKLSVLMNASSVIVLKIIH